ncbi:MAG: VCBS repeat-containing protein [Bacteroidales bacterium]|nr:VCBS repeat-containing protein [Bacteroidales bacterium]
MKTKFLLFLISLFAFSAINSQTFTPTEIELTGLHFSLIEWADFNADGNMDLIISGVNNSNSEELFLYQNNGDNTISEVMIPAPALYYGDIAWGNFDNDKDIDFIMMGLTTDGNEFSMLYENTDGNSFQENSLSLPMRSVGSCSFVDFNNDGFLDIFLSGNTGQTNSVHLFKNNGDKTFTQIQTPFVGLSRSSVKWSDFDNDGDFDIFISGEQDDNQGYIANLYTNNGDGTFKLDENSFTKFCNGNAGWGDYNNDGYDDLIITGQSDNETFICELYKNNGNGTFSIQTTDFTGLAYSTIDWGDFDNDGDLDILQTGCNLA